jgi:hypothetical protein
MDLASFSRFAFVSQAKFSSDSDRDILFFTPCEELDGANILQRVSNNYETIKPFLEKINPQFIDKMNHSVKNIVKYLNSFYTTEEIHQSIDIMPKIIKINNSNITDQIVQTFDKIHMY